MEISSRPYQIKMRIFDSIRIEYSILRIIGLLFFQKSYTYAQTNWQVYDTSNSILPSNYIRDIAYDEDSLYWVATGDGLCSFDGENWKLYTHQNCDMASSSVNCIEISGDSLWLGSAGKLMLYDLQQDVWTNYALRDYFPDLNSFDPGLYVTDITRSAQNELYLATREGMITFNGNSFQRYYHLNSALISDNIYHRILADPFQDSIIWMGLYAGGIACFNTQNQSFQIFNPYPSSSQSWLWDHVNDLFFDDEGYLWTAGTGGIMKIDKNTMSILDFYTPTDGLLDGYYWAVQRENDAIWTGSDLLGSLQKCTIGSNCIYYNSSNSGMPSWNGNINTQVSNIVIDPDGNKFLSTFSGLVIFNENGIQLNIDEQIPLSISIMPNPASEYLKIQSHQGQIKKVEVLNQIGSCIMKFDISTDEVYVDFTEYPVSYYFLKIYTEKEIHQKLFFKY